MDENKMEDDQGKSWGRHFWDDLKNVKFLPLKSLLFLTYGANWVVLPFLSLQARALGLTGEEVGIIYSCLTIPTLIFPISICVLADKIGNFKNLLLGLTLISTVWPLLFTLIPQGRITHHLPDDIVTKLTCTSTNASILIEDLYGCEHTHQKSFNMSYTACYLQCQSMTPNLQGTDNVACESGKCSFNVVENWFATNRTSELFDEDIVPSSQNWTAVFQAELVDNETWVYQSPSPFCPRSDSADVPDSCTSVCEGTISRKEACTKTTYVEELNPKLTFYLRLIVRFVFASLLCTGMPLTQGATISVMKQLDGDYGLQRMYANLGMMVLTPLAGLLVEQLSDEHGASSYNPAIYMYCCLKTIAVVIIFFVDLDFKPQSSSLMSDIWTLLKRFEVVTFILIAYFGGQFYGFLELFLFWLLEDIGASRTMMGLTITVGSGSGVLLLLFSSSIIKKLGYVNTIVFALMCYVVRLTGYTLISNPWAAMPFEVMEAFTNSLISVTFTAYSCHLAPMTTLLTLQGITSGLYYGFGKASGSMIGGFLIDLLGIKQAFRTLALASGVGGVLYFITHFIDRAVTSSNRSEDHLKEKNVTIELENGDTADSNKK